jgi:c-di-GMP-binding flagellar brake protein YcgR
MDKAVDDRRKHKRVLFTVEDGIVGILNAPDNGGDPLEAQVVNISSGGVKLIFKPILKNRIKQGDRLVLSEIRGTSSSQVIVDIDTEVRWITEDELSENIGLGVEFLEVLDDHQQKIDEIVDFWYLQKM